MAIRDSFKKQIVTIMEEYLNISRPPAHLRDELDIAYRVENQSVEILEIRPAFNNPGLISEKPIAKATFVKRSGIWNIYWMRADLKWHRYQPVPEVDNFESFLTVVEDDH